MTYQDEYDDYDEYYEYDDYDDYEDDEEPSSRGKSRRAVAPRSENQLTRQAIDWGVGGSILAIVVLTALYVLSPLDIIPDLIPVAGQADDIAAVLAGGGSVLFLTIARYVFQAALASRLGRIGCLITIILSAIGAFTVFWLLLQVLNSVV